MDILQLIFEPFTYAFMQRGLTAGLFVGVLCAIMGTYVVLKGMAFLGDALAHAIMPGVAISYIFGGSLFVGAIIAAGLVAIAIGSISKGGAIKEDTAIGILFAFALSLGIAMISSMNTYAVDLSHILFGNILGVSVSDLWVTIGSSVMIISILFVLYKPLLVISFDPVLAKTMRLPTDLLNNLILVLLAITVVISLQTVGVSLSAAMLVTPAGTAYLLTRRLSSMMMVSALLGAASAFFGLLLSYYLNIVSGSAIVLVATFIFLVVYVIKKGKR